MINEIKFQIHNNSLNFFSLLMFHKKKNDEDWMEMIKYQELNNLTALIHLKTF